MLKPIATSHIVDNDCFINRKQNTWITFKNTLKFDDHMPTKSNIMEWHLKCFVDHSFKAKQRMQLLEQRWTFKAPKMNGNSRNAEF